MGALRSYAAVPGAGVHPASTVGLAAGKGIEEKSGVGAGDAAADHEGDGVWLMVATEADDAAPGAGPRAWAAVVRARMKIAAEAVRANLANIE